VDDDNRGNVAEPALEHPVDAVAQEAWGGSDTPAIEPETEVVEAETVQEIDVAPVLDAEELPQEKAADSPSRSRRPRAPRAPRKRPDASRARKTPRR
jgi:hypothetical protein